ncbi:hypothetical protein ACFL17_03730 [Pseudomonadota bacterium]
MLLKHDILWSEVIDRLNPYRPEFTTVLAPIEFGRVFDNVNSYSALQCFAIDRYDVVVVHKGILDDFNQTVVQHLFQDYHLFFANEVFVIFTKFPMGNERYQPNIHTDALQKISKDLPIRELDSERVPRKTNVLFEPGNYGPSTRGGIYNGSIVSTNDGFIGLFRAEATAEYESRLNTSARPLLVRFDQELNQISHSFLEMERTYPGQRIEDFRLFRNADGAMLVNHPLVTEHAIRQVISKIDFNQNELTNHLNPLVDIECEYSEKNWVYFYHQNKLHLIYSLDPYRVLINTSGNCFSTIINRTFKYPWQERGYMSNSTNPIDFNKDYYLSFFHDRDTAGIYRQGAMLISKHSLLPAYCSFQELFKNQNNLGYRKGVLYTMSCAKVGSRILLTHGEGDSSTTYDWLSAEEIKIQMKRVDVRES